MPRKSRCCGAGVGVGVRWRHPAQRQATPGGLHRPSSVLGLCCGTGAALEGGEAGGKGGSMGLGSSTCMPFRTIPSGGALMWRTEALTAGGGQQQPAKRSNRLAEAVTSGWHLKEDKRP